MKLSLKELQELETEMLSEVASICEQHKITYYLGYGSVIGAIRHKGPIPWDSDIDIVVPINHLDSFLNKMREELSGRFYVDYYDTNSQYESLFPRIGLRGYESTTLHIDVFMLIGTSSDKSEQIKHKKELRKQWYFYKFKKLNKTYFNKTSLKRKLIIIGGRVILFPFTARSIKNKFLQLCQKYPYKNAESVINANEGYKGKGVLKKSVYGKGILIEYSDIKVMIPTMYESYLKHFYGDYMKLPSEEEQVVGDFFNIGEIKPKND